MPHLTEAQYLEIDLILDNAPLGVTDGVREQIAVVLAWSDPWHPPIKLTSEDKA